MNVARKTIFMGNGITYVIKLIIACLLITQSNAHAGFVLGRGVINSENGDTIWAEYNADGGYLILENIKDNDAHTVAGSTLLAYQNQLQAYEVRNPNSQYLPKSTFDSVNITAQNGKPFNKPSIPEEAKIVVLPAADKILTEKHEFIEYIWLPYDLKAMGGIPSRGGQGSVPEVSSYLISKDGDILHEATDEGSSIGPLNGYYYPKDDAGNLILEQREYENGALPNWSNTSDQLINPVPGVEVWGFGNKRGSSQEDGWIAGDLALCSPKPPIPGYYHRDPAITISARLPFIGFNASEPKQRAYFAHGLAWCDEIPSNIFVSMQSVMGGAQIFNPDAGIVPLTAKTSFYLDTQRNEATYLSSIDFDGDDIKDPASYLKYNEAEKTYIPLDPGAASEATHIGIYFSTGVKTDPITKLTIPSIIRAVDRIPQYINKGLLKTINTVDLAQTDLFVFRVSTGQLITSHKGIEQGTFDDDHTQGGTFNNAFNFEFAMRGPDDYWAQFTPYSDYVSWASATKVTEPFQKRNADHIRPGEQLQLVVINRASGYIGSIKFTSKQVGVGGDINNALDSIIMRPPNLKIWAERVHEIKQGKQVAGEKDSTNVIGNEGITLEDDLAVSIHTEWLDHNGLPLPAELGDFGYTARIAKVTSAPTPDLDALKQNSSNEFAIKPGRNLNVLQFNQKELSRHHFYVQVNPYPKSQQNDFGSEIYNPLHKNYLPDGSGTDEHELPSVDNVDLEGNQTTQNNPLRYRPAHYVPFKVPLYDEKYSQIQQDVYDDLKEQGQAEGMEKPDPLYGWYYRPELQFSQYNFDAKSLIVNQIDDEGEESITEIEIEDDGADFGPIFDSYTDSVELLFDLLGPQLDRLPALENDREFVLSLGGEEAIATIGADGKVTFNNPEHLAQLTEADLLSLRLYLNGDAGNVLWEYAFDGLQIFPPEGAVVELNADQAAELPAVVSGYVTTAAGNETEAYRIRWNSLLGSQPSPDLQVSFAGIFSTTAVIDTEVGTEAQVEGTLLGQETAQKSAIFRVTEAGQAFSIDAQITGSASVANNGQYIIEATVKDRFGNLVSDGTAVSILAPGFDIDSNNQTLNGKVIANLSGLDHAGSFEVTLASGNAVFTKTLSISNITVQITAPTTIAINESALVTFTTSAEDGALIYIGNKRGRFKERLLYVQNGQASAQLEAGEFRGKGFITARIGSTVTKHDFNVIETGGITLLDTVLVTDVLVAGSNIIEGKTVEYTPSTAIRLTGGVPGEQAQVSLLDYLDPSLPEILDYSFVQPPASNQIADRIQGKIATLENIRWENSGLYLTDNQSNFNIQSLTTPTDQAGITFAINPETNGQLLELPNIGLQISITNSQLVVSLSGSQIESASLAFSQWQKVGIHWHNGELILQVDEAILKTPIAAVANLSGDALIGSGFTGGINDIRFYNWLAPAQLTLADGTQEGSGTYDQQGVANVGITTNPAAIAYQQQLRRSEMIAQMERGFSLMSSTYAADPVISLVSQCQVPDINSENYLNASAAMIEYIGSCMLKNNLKKAKIKVQNSEGFAETSVALIEQAYQYQAYAAFYAIKTAGHFGTDCAIGAVTGNVETGARMTCDLITSFYLIGDVRDLIIHGYYWGTSNNEFDKATVVFASIGLAGSSSIILAGSGVPVAALAAGAKVVAKFLNRAPVITHIADDIWESYATHGKTMAEALERTSPLLMITAFVVLEGESLVQVKDFVVEAIDDKEDFDAWIDYTQAFFKKAAQSSGLTAQNIPRELLNLLIAEAYAGVVDKLDTPVVRSIVKMMSDLQVEPLVGKVTEGFRLPKEFTKAIKLVNETPDSELKTLLSGENSAALRGMLLVGAVADKEGMRRLLNYQGSVNIANDVLFDSLNKLNEITDLVDDADLPAIREGLGKVFRQLQAGEGTTAFYKSHGAANEIYELAYQLQNGAKLTGVQVTERISSNVRDLGRRVYDYQLEVGSEIINYDKKAWTPSDINSRLRDSLNFKVASKEDAVSQFGQLYKDIVKSYQNQGVAGFGKYVWVFDQRMLDAHGGDVDAMRQALAGQVRNVIQKNPNLKAQLASDLGFGSTELNRVDEIYPLLQHMFEATPNIIIEGL